MSDNSNRNDCKIIVDPLVVGEVCNLCGVPHELDFIPDFPTPPASPVPASLFAPISPDTYGTWSTGEPTPPSSPVQDSSSVSLSQVRRRARRGNTHIRVTIKVKVRLSSRPKGSRGNNGGLDHCF